MAFAAIAVWVLKEIPRWQVNEIVQLTASAKDPIKAFELENEGPRIRFGVLERTCCMRRKSPAHENHERWLISYADFITLLFAFFVVMLASSQADKSKAQEMSDAVKSAFEDTHFRATVTAVLGGTVNDKGQGNAQVKGPGGAVVKVQPQAIREKLAELMPSLLKLNAEPEEMSPVRAFAFAELQCTTILNETHHHGSDASYTPRRGWGGRVDHCESGLEGRGERAWGRVCSDTHASGGRSYKPSAAVSD
jgi:hypothetical protein